MNTLQRAMWLSLSVSLLMSDHASILARPVRANDTELRAGAWAAWLDAPGGDLPFLLTLDRAADGTWSASIRNGLEEMPVPRVVVESERLTLAFVHYNSTITASISGNGAMLDGRWRRRQGLDDWTVMNFHARPLEASTVQSDDDERPKLAERWSVDFASSDDPAVGMFQMRKHPLGNCVGTFMTTTGDYRFLGGRFDGLSLELSVFDGAHAFLFKAKLNNEGALVGDFWSRLSWHETWTAMPDEDAKLPDAFAQTRWIEGTDFAELQFPNLDGQLISLADPRFIGSARIIEVFGTWCPNCYDATRYMLQLDEQFGARGLKLLGLAFEMTGDHSTDAKQVQRYVDHHGIDYPVLIAGIADKASATRSFPALDRVRSYPTFIFIDADDKVRAVYTGFTGPATGKGYDKLRDDFERIIEDMLSD